MLLSISRIKNIIINLITVKILIKFKCFLSAIAPSAEDIKDAIILIIPQKISIKINSIFLNILKLYSPIESIIIVRSKYKIESKHEILKKFKICLFNSELVNDFLNSISFLKPI